MYPKAYLAFQPGHALVITQWKPELALSTDMTLINLTVPDAIPTIKSIWTGKMFHSAFTQLTTPTHL